MTTYEAIRNAVRKLTRSLTYLGMFLLVPMMLLTASEVVARGAWDRPIPGTLEISSYLLAIFLLLGIAYTQQVKGHVRVTMLTSRLPDTAREVLYICTTGLTLFIVVILCWQGWRVGIEETTVSDMLRIPQRPFRLLVSLGAGLLALELILDMVDAALRIARRQ